MILHAINIFFIMINEITYIKVIILSMVIYIKNIGTTVLSIIKYIGGTWNYIFLFSSSW